MQALRPYISLYFHFVCCTFIRSVDLFLNYSLPSETTDEETHPENLDIKHRPINIAKLYQRLLSESWQEAKRALDKVKSEDAAEMHKVKLLFNIMMVCVISFKSMPLLLLSKLLFYIGV